MYDFPLIIVAVTAGVALLLVGTHSHEAQGDLLHAEMCLRNLRT